MTKSEFIAWYRSIKSPAYKDLKLAEVYEEIYQVGWEAGYSTGWHNATRNKDENPGDPMGGTSPWR